MTAPTPLISGLPPIVAASHVGAIVATAIILVVSLIALVLTFMTLRAYRSSGNRKVLWVFWAFALFFAKGAFLVAGILVPLSANLLFIVAALVDLVIVILLITPFFR